MDDHALTALLDRGFEFLCDRRVADLVDPEALLAALDAAATPERTARLVARLAAPARARVLAELRKSDRLLSGWLPDAARQALAQWLEAPVEIPPDLIEDLVESEGVRQAAREILRDAIAGAVGRASRGSLGLIAGAASLLGGVGGELTDRLAPIVDAGVALVQRRLAQRLRSPEMARALGRRRRRAFLSLLRRRESDAARWLERIPHATLDALLPEVIAHNLSRKEVRTVVRAELRAAIAELSTTPIGELLDELGLREWARAQFTARGLPLARDFLAFLAAPQKSVA